MKNMPPRFDGEAPGDYELRLLRVLGERKHYREETEHARRRMEFEQSLGGWFFGACAVLLITLLAWRRSGNIRVAAGLGIAVFILAISNFTVRTQAISVPLFAVELYVLWRWPGGRGVATETGVFIKGSMAWRCRLYALGTMTAQALLVTGYAVWNLWRIRIGFH